MISRWGPDLAFGSGSAQPASRRLAVLQDYVQRVPMDHKLPAHAPFADVFDEHRPPSFCPLVHVRKHL